MTIETRKLHEPTRTTEEAMAVLRSNDQKAYFIAYARWIAVQICQAQGTVHSRLVRDEMEKRGCFIGYHGKDFWLGAVFRDGPFLPTGLRFKYTDGARNIHDREVRVWQLDPQAPAVVEPTLPTWLIENWKARGIKPELMRPASRQ